MGIVLQLGEEEPAEAQSEAAPGLDRWWTKGMTEVGVGGLGAGPLPPDTQKGLLCAAGREWWGSLPDTSRPHSNRHLTNDETLTVVTFGSQSKQSAAMALLLLPTSARL